MPGIRDIKRRIRAVTNTQHVTRAMKMVAAAKLRRSQNELLSARPYALKLAEVVSRLARAPQARELPLLTPREVKTVGYVLITGNRGLAGAFNTTLINLAAERLAAEKRSAVLITVGEKGFQFFRRRPVKIRAHFAGTGDDFSLSEAREPARQLMTQFLEGQLDEINIIYARFHSALHHVPSVSRFLPVLTPAPQNVEEIDYIYEPEAMGILGALLPRYCESKIYLALLETKAGEHSTRMLAMEGATGNAGEMIEQLTLSFNKARQAAITNEILEIASGAEILRFGH